MKYTAAQMKALRAVADGKVTHYESNRFNSTGKSIFGYRKDIIQKLYIAKLITLPFPLKRGCHTKYVLTDAGRQAVEG